MGINPRNRPETERDRLRQRRIVRLIEDEVDRLGRMPPPDELFIVVLQVMPDAGRDEFRTALVELYAAVG